MRILTLAAISGLCALLAGHVRADETPAEPAPLAQPTTDQVLAYLGTKLSLSEAQKASIAPVITDRRQKLNALRDDTALPALKRRRQVMSILADSDSKINAVLSPDQQKQYADIEREVMQKLKTRAAQ